eukprot:GGOE01000863.1.p1 GENE.GGOE01000863.1~~GGOE01000863.1.p1  ORF type:complete len:816 (+),score=202.42 GGOE01000863.1:65-2449(+)
MPKVVMPTAFTVVYNDQCMFSFDTPFSAGGIYVNMNTHCGFGEDFVEMDHERTKCGLYVHLQWKKVRKEKKLDNSDVSKLAIGIEGGFDPDNNFDVVKSQSICVFPQRAKVDLPNNELPEMVSQVADAIVNHEGSAKAARVTWEEDTYHESVFARELVQLNTGKKISPNPKTWVDDETGEQSDNLWLNLSTGHIGGGRRQMNAKGEWTGSGSALKHFQDTGRQYPLAVKLGTISARGGDVYSYAEDEMVTDPKLAEHLAHWGINMMQMEKTGKSMAEMNIDLNLQFEYNKILENDKALTPISGAGYIGIENLGNSCYMNSVVQAMFAVPELKQRYVAPAAQIFQSAPPEVQDDFPVQMAKLGMALHSNRYTEDLSTEEEDLNAAHVVPFMFKRLVGKGHVEFSSDRQQDAAEYFQHLLEIINRTERQHSHRLGGDIKTAELFKFEMEIRTECTRSHKVRYSQTEHSMLDVPVPMECAINKPEYDEYRAKRQRVGDEDSKKDVDPVLAKVPFDACLQKFAAEETITDFFSSALQSKGEAVKTVRLRTFPKYLIIQLRKFYVDTDWTAKKMEVELVDLPDDLDLEWLRSTGLKAGEELLSDDTAQGQAAPQPDPTIVAMVMSMGFSQNAGKRAALATSNRSAEEAVNWVLSHMEDADLNDPVESNPTTGAAVDQAQVATLQEMGFTAQQATVALKSCDMSMERAVEWLFSHADTLDSLCAPATATATQETSTPAMEAKGHYRLLGFISHLGKNTGCGHYVVHLKKDGKWILFNDRKVGVSENPPRGMGYLYIFERK